MSEQADVPLGACTYTCYLEPYLSGRKILVQVIKCALQLQDAWPFLSLSMFSPSSSSRISIKRVWINCHSPRNKFKTWSFCTAVNVNATFPPSVAPKTPYRTRSRSRKPFWTPSVYYCTFPVRKGKEKRQKIHTKHVMIPWWVHSL
jgi:hypothetical protein